ncbi:MAG: FtsX-like permease family protein [Lentisphaerae bacterium]|nr:FtsX-like permease family protein [Lentisphaerota bacterium]
MHNLFLHKIRSFLTSLGIIFGVGSVISMLAISGGAKKEALAQIDAMGIDKIIVYSKAKEQSNTSSSSSTSVLDYGLNYSDQNNILKMENIKRVTTARRLRTPITKGLETLDIELFWVSLHFQEDVNCDVIKGRWLTPSDFENSSTVCVIGRNVKRKIFGLGEKEIVGKTITVGKSNLKVVGVIENKADTKLEGINNLNDSIFIPSTTGVSIFTEYEMIGSISSATIHHVENDLFIVKVDDLEVIDHTAKRISAFMGRAHKTKDWGISVPLNLLRKKEATQNIFTIVMGSIAGISLIVGGIGIMNIMLANVYERRKEIGTRRAIGARKRDILYQFLIETVFLTILGGLLGIGLGIGIAAAITHFSGMPSEVSVISIVGSMAISGIVGIVFGTYPAWKAANENPIKALKAE